MILRLDKLEELMRAQFVWNADPRRPMQTNELIEGSKDTARCVFTGIANMYGFYVSDICEYLDMGHDAYIEKLNFFRASYKDGVSNKYMSRDAARIYRKTRLVLNAIRTATKQNPYIKMKLYIDNDNQP